jgi:DnaJ-domain-containing protein 1
MLMLAVVAILLVSLVLKTMSTRSEDDSRTLQKTGKRMSRELACKVLDVPPTANEEQVMDAYRRLIQKLHPDQGGSAHLMDMVVQAKNTLIPKGDA